YECHILLFHQIHSIRSIMHWEGIEPSTPGFVDRSSYPIELPVLMRRGVLDSPASRLSGGCSASELTARSFRSFQFSNAREPRLGRHGMNPRTFSSNSSQLLPGSVVKK